MQGVQTQKERHVCRRSKPIPKTQPRPASTDGSPGDGWKFDGGVYSMQLYWVRLGLHPLHLRKALRGYASSHLICFARCLSAATRLFASLAAAQFGIAWCRSGKIRSSRSRLLPKEGIGHGHVTGNWKAGIQDPSLLTGISLQTRLQGAVLPSGLHSHPSTLGGYNHTSHDVRCQSR